MLIKDTFAVWQISFVITASMKQNYLKDKNLLRFQKRTLRNKRKL